jgi:hypothetical protein
MQPHYKHYVHYKINDKGREKNFLVSNKYTEIFFQNETLIFCIRILFLESLSKARQGRTAVRIPDANGSIILPES